MTKEKELDPLIKSTTIAIQCEPHQWRSWPSAQQTENERRRRGIWSQRSARKFVQVQTSRHTTSSRLYLSFGYFIFHPPLFFFFQIVICFFFVCGWGLKFFSSRSFCFIRNEIVFINTESHDLKKGNLNIFFYLNITLCVYLKYYRLVFHQSPDDIEWKKMEKDWDRVRRPWDNITNKKN